MARKKSSAQIETLEEFESLAERMAQWVSQHLVLVAGAITALLLGTGSWAGYSTWEQGQREEASQGYSEILDDYIAAMGAEPGSLEIPELANPMAAERVREEFTERYQRFAANHPSTLQAGLAWVAVGDLASQAEDPQAGIEAWNTGLTQLTGDSPIRGILLGRVAQDHERNGRWLEAAETHAEAGQLANFPLRYFAMAEAARCFDAAGAAQRSLKQFQTLEIEAPDLRLPDFLRSRMAELQSVYGSADRASGPGPEPEEVPTEG